MTQNKYYDHIINRPLDLESDGCDLDDWDRLYGKARFARHPKGFLIFLHPERIESCDEYAESDPYTLEQNINSEFSIRRIEITVGLVQEVANKRKEIVQVLDLGCGQGHITNMIQKAISRAEISGLDYSITAIEYANEHYPEIDFAVGDAYESPYAPGFFDVVVCNNLWEHVPDPLYLLSKIKNTLKPGGYLIISTPSRYRIGNLVRVLRGKAVVFMSKYHVTEYTIGQVKEQLAYGGFDVKRVLSRPIKAKSLKVKLARLLVSTLISIVGSHHQLDSTVFYLAQQWSPEQGAELANDSPAP